MQPRLRRNCHYQKTRKLPRGPTIKEIVKSNVLPSEFHVQGWLSMKANKNGEKKSLLRLLATQGYSLVLCSLLEAWDWANTLQFDFLLPFCPAFAGCRAGLLAAGTRAVWVAPTLFTVTSPISWTYMSQSHPLLKAASKPSFQFVVERERSALGFWSSLGSLQFQFSGWQPHCQWSQRK